MKIVFKLLLIALVLNPAWAVKRAPKELKDKIVELMSDSSFGGKWGLSLISNRHDRMILQWDKDSLFTPASTNKLITTAAVLDTFPEPFRFRTWFELRGEKKGKVFYGQVKVRGMGEPGLSSRFYDSAQVPLGFWVDSLKARGIDSVVGDIKIDKEYFIDPPRPQTWEKRWFDEWYGTEVHALGYNDNAAMLYIIPGEKIGDKAEAWVKPGSDVFEFKNTSSTVSKKRRKIKYGLDPKSNKVTLSGKIGIDADTIRYRIPLRNADHILRSEWIKIMKLRGIGVMVNDSVSKLAEGKEVLDHWFWRGTSFAEAVRLTNYRSHNLTAEILIRVLGDRYYGTPGLKYGIKAEQEFLKRVGFNKSQYHIVDGSGLSYETKFTPYMMTKVLKYMISHPRADDYYNSMAAPDSGTGYKRVKGLESRLSTRFKTGFVNFAFGLAGYVHTSEGDTLSLAIYVNDYKVRDRQAKKLLDSAWTLIADTFHDEGPAIAEMSRYRSWIDSIPFYERLDSLSKYWVGRAYEGGPMGEGMFGKVDKKPRAWTQSFDCVTYIEHVLATAQFENASEIQNTLDSIRYHKDNGKLKMSYETRNHFFVEDWVYKQPKRTELIRHPNDTTAKRKTGKEKLFGFKKLKAPEGDPETKLSYLNLDTAISIYSKPWAGKYEVRAVAFVNNLDWLWVSHTGFLILTPGEKPVLRHASSKQGKVYEQSFESYLEEQKKRKGKVLGVAFFRLKDLNPTQSEAFVKARIVRDSLRVADSLLALNPSSAVLSSSVVLSSSKLVSSSSVESVKSSVAFSSKTLKSIKVKNSSVALSSSEAKSSSSAKDEVKPALSPEAKVKVVEKVVTEAKVEMKTTVKGEVADTRETLKKMEASKEIKKGTKSIKISYAPKNISSASKSKEKPVEVKKEEKMSSAAKQISKKKSSSSAVVEKARVTSPVEISVLKIEKEVVAENVKAVSLPKVLPLKVDSSKLKDVEKLPDSMEMPK